MGPPTQDDINKVIMQSLLMSPPTHDDITKLIQSEDIQYISKVVGCCKRNYLKFEEEEDHYYAYHPPKNISKNYLKNFLHICIEVWIKKLLKLQVFRVQQFTSV